MAVERLKQPERAFGILESARGRALYDSIRYARQVNPKQQNSPVEREIARLQRSLLHDDLSPAQTRRILVQLDNAYDRPNPIEYKRARAEMTMLRSRPPTVAELRTRLDPGEVFVQYLLDAKRSYALRITRSGITVHPLAPRREFSQAARQYVTAVRAKQSPNGQALYKLWVAPILSPDTKALTIVPDGPLHLVPFAALADESGAMLVSRLTVTSVPSATVYTTLKAPRHSGAKLPFLGVAFSPAPSSGDAGAGTRGVRDGRGGQLAALPFGRERSRKQLRFWGVKVLRFLGLWRRKPR